MAVLSDTATILMNLYFQSFRKDEDFFQLYHFMYIAGSVVSKMMEEEYKELKKDQRSEQWSDADIQIPGSWLIREDAKVVDNIITLQHKPFSFPYDPLGRVINQVEAKDGCKEFIRISSKEKWKYNHAPKCDKVFFYVLQDKVYLLTDDTVKDVVVDYVPDPTNQSFGEEGGPVPVNQQDVITRSWLIMAQARQGTVVDMSNNSNPNKTIQTEIDTVFQNLRTKPI